jgi:hypothetical protein
VPKHKAKKENNKKQHWFHIHQQQGHHHNSNCLLIIMAKKKSKSKAEEPAKSEEPKKSDWRYSKAKQIVAQDMFDGIVPIHEPIKNSRKLFNELYADLPEFKPFPYNKRNYDDRFKNLQKTVRIMGWAAQKDQEALAHDRNLHPPPTHDSIGKILWKGSEADKWLRVDVDHKLHEQMTPKELFATRTCYQPFGLRRFTKRIDQLREAAKPHGATPGQNKAKLRGAPEMSRLVLLDPYVNESEEEDYSI